VADFRTDCSAGVRPNVAADGSCHARPLFDRTQHSVAHCRVTGAGLRSATAGTTTDDGFRPRCSAADNGLASADDAAAG
jgi:hypothetical protein